VTVEEAFDHLDTSTELEKEATDHRKRACEKIEEHVVEALDFSAHVDVELGDGDVFLVTVNPDSLVRLADDIHDEDDMSTACWGAQLRLTRGEVDLFLDQRQRIRGLKDLVSELVEYHDDHPGAPVENVLEHSQRVGMDPDKAEQELESLRRKGEIYEPQNGFVRTT
jgi:hypothetical protein